MIEWAVEMRYPRSKPKRKSVSCGFVEHVGLCLPKEQAKLITVIFNPQHYSLLSIYETVEVICLGSWPHWIWIVQLWDMIVSNVEQWTSQQISPSYRSRENNQSSDSLDDPGPQTTLDKKLFWSSYPISPSYWSLSRIFLFLVSLRKGLHVRILKNLV